MGQQAGPEQRKQLDIAAALLTGLASGRTQTEQLQRSREGITARHGGPLPALSRVPGVVSRRSVSGQQHSYRKPQAAFLRWWLSWRRLRRQCRFRACCRRRWSVGWRLAAGRSAVAGFAGIPRVDTGRKWLAFILGFGNGWIDALPVDNLFGKINTATQACFTSVCWCHAGRRTQEQRRRFWRTILPTDL